jgi:galactosylceramidase
MRLAATAALLSASASASALASAPSSGDPLATSSAITLNGASLGHRYDGHGGLSAGASSRGLWDYPAPQRDDILDMLFKPQWGLSLPLLKVEIGGDAQSTDGTEPSHAHSRTDVSCARGYELFLLREAKKRNPDILTYGLSWGAPGWINNGTFFGPEMWAYQTAWAACIELELGFKVDYIGVWNERYWGGTDYVIGLRAALDAAGFSATKIVIPDGGYDPAIMADAAANSSFSAAFDVVGLHYPCTEVHAEVQAGGKSYWASEHWWANPDWAGASSWGHLLSYNYVAMNMTSTIAWSPLWSVYSILEDQTSGLISAAQPWSGAWDGCAACWPGAQWTQFTAPGWTFLSVASNSSGFLPGGGTYVTLIPPTGPAGMTLILETFTNSGRCATPSVAASQTITFTLTGGLPTAGTPLFAWQTNETSQFVNLPDVVVGVGGVITVTMPAETMLTLTTVAGGRKGVPAAPIPSTAAFPVPYADDFSGYADDAMARFFSDQFGSFAVRGGRLVQVAPQSPGANEWSPSTDPLTLIGGLNWANVSVSTTISLPAAPPAAATDGADLLLVPCDTSPEQVWELGSVAPGYLSNGPSPGVAQQCVTAYGCGERAALWACQTTGSTCCGDGCFDSLRFSLSPTGQLVSALTDVGCLTATGASPALIFSRCLAAGTTNQTWALSAAGALQLGASGRCVAQPSPPPPQPAYAQLCARISSYAAFKTPQPPPGYCVKLDARGIWTVTSGKGSLASGALDAPRAPVALSLQVVGSVVTASANGTVMAAIHDTTHVGGGLAALGSSYDAVMFGEFAVNP